MSEPSAINCVIYHADCTDGFGAAYSAWKLLGNRAEYHACKHGSTPPDVKDKNVVVLDFSFNNPTTKQMIKEANSLLVIDHHKSAMVELHDISNTHFDMTKSGAMLAWEWFHPGKEPPKFIQYIQDRDLWKWELPYSKEFAAAFDMVPFEFEEFEKYEDDSVFDDAIKRGSYILAYSKTVVKKVCEKATERKYNGMKVLVVNSSHWMSEIAKVYKGGGHKKAAGFQLSGDLCVDDIFDEEVCEEEADQTVIEEIKEDLKNIVSKAKEAGVSLQSEEIEQVLSDQKSQPVSGSVKK